MRNKGRCSWAWRRRAKGSLRQAGHRRSAKTEGSLGTPGGVGGGPILSPLDTAHSAELPSSGNWVRSLPVSYTDYHSSLRGMKIPHED